MKISLMLMIFFLGQPGVAQVKLAMFYDLDQNQNRIEFEPGGKYTHLAIEVQGRWLHADPWAGVAYKNSLGDFHKAYDLFQVPDLAPFRHEDIKELLGKPFSYFDPWHSRESYYCSKLIALLLAIAPKPMTFEAPFWRAHFDNLPRQSLGISPDEVLQAAKDKYGAYPLTCRPLF